MPLEQFNLSIERNTKRKIKSYAAELGITMQKIVNDALLDAVDNTLPARVQAMEEETFNAGKGAA